MVFLIAAGLSVLAGCVFFVGTTVRLDRRRNRQMARDAEFIMHNLYGLHVPWRPLRDHDTYYPAPRKAAVPLRTTGSAGPPAVTPVPPVAQSISPREVETTGDDIHSIGA